MKDGKGSKGGQGLEKSAGFKEAVVTTRAHDSFEIIQIFRALFD